MKKLLSLALVLGLVLSLASPALASETVTLKLWGSQEDQAMLQEMAESFKAANPDKEGQFDEGGCRESSVQEKKAQGDECKRENRNPGNGTEFIVPEINRIKKNK